MQTPHEPNTKLLRDLAIFLIGGAGAIYQIFFVEAHDPQIIALIAVLLGLPWWLQRDERKKR